MITANSTDGIAVNIDPSSLGWTKELLKSVTFDEKTIKLAGINVVIILISILYTKYHFRSLLFNMISIYSDYKHLGSSLPVQDKQSPGTICYVEVVLDKEERHAY
jgi:hypothetical protein